MDALRDWGHTKDYVEMQWMMLQQEQPEDFVIATGKQYSIRDFIKWSSQNLGLTIEFEGKGLDEIGIVKKIVGDKAPAIQVGDVVIRINKRYYRPAEVETLLGNPSKAKRKLGWSPKITAQELCAEMVTEDLKIARRHAFLKANGHEISLSKEEGAL
jgi:GDPmannose 4,6-dehydratase